jgi:ribose-phosphate pyrophosphokinase
MIYLNGKPLVSPMLTMFPDNTSQVWHLPESTFQAKTALVLWDYTNEAEIMHLAQLSDLLQKENVELKTTLIIKCLPYARQDKPIGNNATFALQTFLKILRTLHFHKIIVNDPHNANAFRPKCQWQAVYPIAEVHNTIKEVQADILCYPDKGALTKYTSIYDYPHIYGEKVRDQQTGNIISYQVVGDCTGKNVLIVDDICDGGATFKLLAKDLLAGGAKSVVLFVTHGIFSKGVRTLFESGIQRVFTQDGEVSERHGSFHL